MSVLANDDVAAADTIAEILAVHLRRNPKAAAILAPGRPVLDYGELAKRVERTMQALADAGLARGKRIAVALPNGPEMAVALLSIICRATCVPLDTAIDEAAAHTLLIAMRVDAIIVAAGERSAIRRAAEAIGLPILEMGAPSEGATPLATNTERGGTPVHAERPRPDDIALLMATSGTTGRPKVVPISQRDLVAGLRRQIAATQLTSADRCLCVTPLFTASGIRRNLLSTIGVGGSVVCVTEFRAADFVAWIREFRPTYYAAGPAIHRAILEECERDGPIGPSSLRYVLSGATALPVDVEMRLERLLGVPVIQALGMSEAGIVACNPLPPGIRRPGSVGRAASGLDVAIHDDEGRALRATESGEVVIRGPGVIRGYEDNPEANRDAFREGWFRTGDLGYFDEDGYLYLTGRMKELINRGGFKVSPLEVDAALLGHPDVVEAATFAVAHPTLGEDVNAAVVVKAGTSAQGLRDFVLERLAPYKVPSKIVVVRSLPRNALGKVARGDLGQCLAQSLREPFTPPRGVREEQVARLFAAVLGRPDIGAFDNFFHLGGDSLRGAQVIAQLNTEPGSRITTTLLFRRPTVAEFATELDAVSRADAPPGLPPIVPLSRIAQSASAPAGERGEQS